MERHCPRWSWPGCRCRDQLVAQAVVTRHDALGVLAEGPDFRVLAVAVQAQCRQEGAVLEPAREQFRIVVVLADGLLAAARIDQRLPGGPGRLRQPLPAADIVAPVGDAGSGHVQASGDLAGQRFPRRVDVGRPEQGAGALGTEIGGARQDQGPLVRFPGAHALLHAFGMQQREQVAIAVAGADRIEVAVRHQVRFRLVQPGVVEALRQDVVAHAFPEPLARGRVGGIDQGAHAVGTERQAVDGLAVLVLQEVALGIELVEIAARGFETRPHRDDRLHAQVVQLLVHGGGSGELRRVDIELAHAGPVEPVEHHDVERVFLMAVGIRYAQDFLLAFVARLGLDQAESSLGRDRRLACHARVTRIDFFRRAAGDDEEADALSTLDWNAVRPLTPAMKRVAEGLSQTMP